MSYPEREYVEYMENYYIAKYEGLATRKLMHMLKHNHVDDNKYARNCLNAVLNTRFARYCDTAPLEQLIDLYVITHEAPDTIVKQQLPGYSSVELLSAFARRIGEFTPELLSKLDGIKIPQALSIFIIKYFHNLCEKKIAKVKAELDLLLKKGDQAGDL